MILPNGLDASASYTGLLCIAIVVFLVSFGMVKVEVLASIREPDSKHSDTWLDHNGKLKLLYFGISFNENRKIIGNYIE